MKALLEQEYVFFILWYVMFYTNSVTLENFCSAKVKIVLQKKIIYFFLIQFQFGKFHFNLKWI